MRKLTKMHLVQYSFWDYETFNLHVDGTAFIGPNGAGKTSLLDAIQIALLGAHGQYTQFNPQSIYKDRRTVRDYALGMIRSGDASKGVITRKRDEALSYISLVFEGDTPEDCVSCGVCIHAQATEKQHRVLGLYVLPGVRLQLDHHLGAPGLPAWRRRPWPGLPAPARQPWRRLSAGLCPAGWTNGGRGRLRACASPLRPSR